MVLLPLLQIKPPKPGFVAGDAADGTLCASALVPSQPRLLPVDPFPAWEVVETERGSGSNTQVSIFGGGAQSELPKFPVQRP